MREILRGHEVVCAESGSDALKILGERHDIALVLQDIVMPAEFGEVDEREGLAVLRELQKLRPALPVVMLSSLGDVDVVVEAMRSGAQNYLTKPPDPDKLRQVVEHTARQPAGAPAKPPATRQGLGTLIGSSKPMQNVYGLIERAAKSDCNVLVMGESGSGKELVANEVHRRSRRVEGPFKALNCSSISASLLESILFGHKKGAFTGAESDQRGLFRAAHGGTLFLDEIGDMAVELQAKLLRSVEDKKVLPVGSTEYEEADVRIISATNQNLPERVRDGKFREDLFYRLNLLLIALPPLRDRKDDIPILAEHFARQCAEKEGREFARIAPAAMDALLAHSWPGNVRELQNKIHSAVIKSAGNELTEALFDFSFASAQRAAAPDALWRELLDESRHPHDMTELRNRHGADALKDALQRAVDQFGDIRSAGRAIGVISESDDAAEYARFRKWLSKLGVSKRANR